MIKDKSLLKVILFSTLGVFLIFIFLFRGLLKYEVKSFINSRSAKYSTCYNCDDYFPDNVAVQERALKTNVIKPQKELTDLDKLKSKGILIELKTNDDYIITEMPSSRPFVMPSVNVFLNELVDLYKTELKDLDYVRFEITSATRSRRSVKELTKKNVNSITNSPHLKGKSIDISYVRFGANAAQLNAFVQALKKMRENNKCFVKYERSQGCLHITVR